MKDQLTREKKCSAYQAALDDALYAIGGKWKLRVISALKHAGAMRFNELQRAIAGISARVLSNELKDLELNGFVKRIVYTQTPVIVEYALTDYADSLGHVLQSLIAWGEQHRITLREAHRAQVTGNSENN
ncbi:helix-turn-helix transcriptional regulator [Chitinophaga pendula]|uniref:winged helix-turn-helix transcriptional regulator n=1 Tax=Chitinophaga TaxID=79328 RepID=UPI000BAFE4D1|nr:MULTISPECIES: helix-turn-helix domain-containing protein [Chitinophaga]ASZ13591.1 transcriptional regulator [Chitinophaga sp. MD30]UCJ08786.1 helix-turn-helix transcriptional regulator [Chitinophaga pendula]